MRKLLMTVACLLCFILNASIGDSPIEKSEFSTIQNVGRAANFDIQQNPTPYFIKDLHLEGAASKAAFKPKGPPPKQQSKSGKKNPPTGGHDKNQRESNREKYENADARRQREQKKAEEKKEQNKKASNLLWE